MGIDVDVAIVGAGAAGVAAARGVAAAGRSVVLLEAADRAGGRAMTVEAGGMPLDLGCGWLHSADRNPLVPIARAAGFTIVEGPTAWRGQWRDLGFPAADQAAAWAEWQAFRTRIGTAPPPSDRAGDAIDRDARWSAFADAASGYMNGAPLADLSVADFLAYEEAATDRNWRVAEGYGTLVAALPPPGVLRLSSPVDRVAIVADGVRVAGPRGDLTARTAIVTVSTAVLASGAIAFDPVTDDHLHAASRLPLGLADKIYIELVGDHPFERETHLIGNPHDRRTISHYIRPLGRPVIEGFVGGVGAAALADEGAGAAFALAVDELVALVGSDVRRHLRPLVATCWRRLDRIGGSYSHALPGHAGARAILAAPVADRLFFAGEATHPTDFSTAHGAWESGLAAAAQALRAIG